MHLLQLGRLGHIRNYMKKAHSISNASTSASPINAVVAMLLQSFSPYCCCFPSLHATVLPLSLAHIHPVGVHPIFVKHKFGHCVKSVCHTETSNHLLESLDQIPFKNAKYIEKIN